MRAHWTGVVALLGAFAAAWAAELPELVLPQGVGVNIHFARGHERDLDLIAAAGFRFIRMDFGWGGIERQKGIYDWSEYDELTGHLEKRGLRAIYIFDYSNELYEPGASPQHPESVGAFARWAAASTAHFKGRHIIWEIWNEPNIDFWKPKPDAKQYLALALATCQAVRQSDPGATVIAPASSEFPWSYLETLFRGGLLEQLDAVSIHPYRDRLRPPETASEDYRKLRALIQRFASPAKKNIPIVSGEWGYSTHARGVSLDTQAAFLSRQQLANLACGVPLSIWYDWKNDGDNAAENEHNFGTVYPDLRPKPSYEALQAMTRQLSGFRVARRLESVDSTSCVLLLVNGAGDQKLAAWSSGPAQAASVDIGGDSPADLAMVDGSGKPEPVELDHGKLHLALSALPQYVTIKKPSRSLAAAAAWTVGDVPPVRAGVQEGLAVDLTVRNPFSYPVTARAELTGPNLSISKSVKLRARELRTVVLAAAVSRRDLPQISATLGTEMIDGAGALVGRWAEALNFSLANPLSLVMAPVEHGFRVNIQSDSSEGFKGYLEAGQERYPVLISSTESAAVITVHHSLTDTGSHLAAMPCRLLDNRGQVSAETSGHRFHLLPRMEFSAKLDGDAKVSANSSVAETAAVGQDPPYAEVHSLDYQFEEGWRFVRCEASQPIPFEPAPVAFGLWIYGDGSRNSLRIRVRDASGQTFQPAGPNLDWTGWRWVTFDLKDLGHAGYWGGANDGEVKGTLALDTALLIDSGKRKTSGKIYFAGMAVAY